MQKKLVSIIIPVYNRETIIKATLESIINQDYKNWECLVIDDGSVDGTKQVVNRFSSKDTRIKYFERPRHLANGANTCRNYGFSLVKGEYVNWFDSDDIMYPDFISVKVSAFNKSTNAVLHRNRYSNYQLTRFRDSKFHYTKHETLFYHYALEDLEIQTCGFMWKRDYLENKELFNNQIERFQDNEFHIRMLNLRPEIEIVNKVLATIRGGNGNESQISSITRQSKKKLYDIFYVRYLTLKLSKASEYRYNKVFNKQLSKKMLWAFYTFLRFETVFINRLNTFRKSINKLGLIHRNNDLDLLEKFKSIFYIIKIIFFRKS